MKHNGRVFTLLALLGFLSVSPSVFGQSVPQPAEASEVQQRDTGGDPIRQLNLTPEQREQIRSIREDKKVERTAINQRLRAANQALNQALDSDNPDEVAIEQRVRDVSEAQAAVMRMRILTEIRIRRVLTREQRILLKSLQQQANRLRRERGMDSDNAENRQLRQERRAVQNQRNGLAPLQPRRNLPRRNQP